MSAVPAVKAALVAQLASLFPTAQVSYGAPLKATSEDIVAVQGARSTVEPDALDMTGSVREVIDLDVTFSVWRGRGTQQVVTERAYTMLESLRAWLNDNPTIGGVAQHASLSYETTMDEAQTDSGPVCEIATTVRVFAHATP